MLTYREYIASDFSELVRLSRELFRENSDYDRQELEVELKQVVEGDNFGIFFAMDDDKYIWYINMSLRTDYVEGAETSPVWYIEEIFVQPQYRLQGIAKQLLEHGKKWIQARWCTEIWSDTWLDNTDSQEFHEALSFEEEERLVHYLMKI